MSYKETATVSENLLILPGESHSSRWWQEMERQISQSPSHLDASQDPSFTNAFIILLKKEPNDGARIFLLFGLCHSTTMTCPTR